MKVEKLFFTRFLDTIHPHTSLFIAHRPLSQPAVSAARSVTTHPLAALTPEGARIILRRNQSYQYVEVFSASFSIMEIIATLGTPIQYSLYRTLLTSNSFCPPFSSFSISFSVSHIGCQLSPLSHIRPLLCSPLSQLNFFIHSLLFPFPSRSLSLSEAISITLGLRSVFVQLSSFRT